MRRTFDFATVARVTTEDLGRVERIGNTVHRPTAPWTPAVHDLLRHLESVGYECSPRLHDVAYALEYTAPFRDDAMCLRWLRYPEPPDRRRRLEVFATAYGLTDTSGLVDEVIEVQQAGVGAVARLAEQGHEPQATWVADGHLDELRERVAWSRANRHLID